MDNNFPLQPIERASIAMDTEVCSQQGSDIIESCSQPNYDNSQVDQRTPISSQILPMNVLDIMSSQCSTSSEVNIEISPISTRKGRKRKGYRAKSAKNRADMKKRRLNDPQYCIDQNKRRLESFKEEIEDPFKREMYNKRQFKLITKKLKDPAKRKEHNERKSKRLEDPVKQRS